MFVTVANSYMDESFDPKHKGKYRGFFVVGGMLGRGWAVFELERRWERLLDKHGLTYFKASQCENGWKQFSKFVADSKNITKEERAVLDAISLEFIALIVNPVPFDAAHYLTCYGVGIQQEDFYEVIKSEHARKVLGDNPYRLAYDFAFVQGAWLMKQLGEGWGASFVCDEHEIYSPLAPVTYHKLKGNQPRGRAIHAFLFQYRRKKMCSSAGRRCCSLRDSQSPELSN